MLYFFLQQSFRVTGTNNFRFSKLLGPRIFCLLAWTLDPPAVACSYGLEDISADFVAFQAVTPEAADEGGLISIPIRCSRAQLFLDLPPAMLPGSAHLGLCKEAPESYAFLERSSRVSAAGRASDPPSRSAAHQRRAIGGGPGWLLPSPSRQDGGRSPPT